MIFILFDKLLKGLNLHFTIVSQLIAVFQDKKVHLQYKVCHITFMNM